MNKLTKAAIAGSVGVALLLGGAGTLATWNSSSNVSGGTIVSGNLAVGNAAAGSWSVAHLTAGSSTVYGTATPITSLATFKASPGDKLTYTTTMSITASGDNLAASLALAPGAITATTSTPANTALAGALTSAAAVSLSGAGITGTAPNYTITPATAGVSSTATVTATVTYPLSTTAGAENTSMNGSVDFAGMAVSLTQKS
jgi:alternate signal-mediated exported protein